MDYQNFFDTAKMLFERFGLYSILLVLGTTLIMIPINMLYKKLFKKDSLNRLRKTVSCLSVYLVALGLVAFFTWLVFKEPLTIEYLFSSCMSCGLLSMFLWAVIKFIRDYGWMPVWNVILANKEAKAWLKEIGLSEKLVDVISQEVKKYLKDKNIVSLDAYLEKELDIKSHLRLQMSGFVTSDKINDAITNILQPIKNKLK